VIGFSGPTLADRLIASANRPAGFDYLRLLLASSVIATHSLALTLTDFHRLRPLAALILPMFFALSGFLVCGSLVRCRTLGTFLALRVLRLFPALVVETVLSALVIGPVFTSLPLNSYFEDPSFLGYFTSLVGVVKYKLPGVFTTNPFRVRQRPVVDAPVRTLLLFCSRWPCCWGSYGGMLSSRPSSSSWCCSRSCAASSRSRRPARWCVGAGAGALLPGRRGGLPLSR
jgi:hypothetical protein